MSAVVPADRGSQGLVLDASVAIHLMAINSWHMLFRLNGLELSLTKLVEQEIGARSRRMEALRKARVSGKLAMVDEPLPFELLSVFVEASKRLGQGDASVLVHGMLFGHGIATDDRRLRNEADRRGVRPILGTEDLLALAVRQGKISLHQGNSKLTRLRGLQFNSSRTCLCTMCGVTCTH